VLTTVDSKSAQFNASVDELQKLITGLAQNKDPIAGAIPPLASAENDLTEMLQNSRRPLQGVIENVRPLATEIDNRKVEVNGVLDPLAENYLRLNALGAYGARPAAHRHLRYHPGGVRRAGVLRLQQVAVLAAGQAL
jgi:phospholipid/cholesterol/gamma-HCH transport system substrate-binding protein